MYFNNNNNNKNNNINTNDNIYMVQPYLRVNNNSNFSQKSAILK